MYEEIKKDILGSDYSLSIAFVSPAQSRKLNLQYRGKDKPTNVLAFPLSKDSGEIILCKDVIKKEAKNFDKTPKKFEGFLVIHAMLHLKGYEHSSKMERAEKKYDQKYFYRDRHRQPDDQSRRGRISKRRKKS